MIGRDKCARGESCGETAVRTTKGPLVDAQGTRFNPSERTDGRHLPALRELRRL